MWCHELEPVTQNVHDMRMLSNYCTVKNVPHSIHVRALCADTRQFEDFTAMFLLVYENNTHDKTPDPTKHGRSERILYLMHMVS